MRIIHLGTHITATFGMLDDEDNVVDKRTAELDLSILRQGVFNEACDAIRNYWHQLTDQQTADRPRGDTDVPSDSPAAESS